MRSAIVTATAIPLAGAALAGAMRHSPVPGTNKNLIARLSTRKS